MLGIIVAAFTIVLVNDVHAFFGLEGLLTGSTANRDFQVYWNVPTFMCHKYNMRFEEVSRYFGIVQNPEDKFRGSEIAMLYDPGMFPALLPNPSNGSIFMRNGGVPQRGNLTAHLKRFREEVLDHIPDPEFRGLGVIDFESWRPIYRQNWATLAPYRDLSEKIVKKRHPSWDDKSVRREAAWEFEKWGKTFMEETLRVAREMRPRAAWSYYAFPYCFNYTPHQTSERCDPKVLQENDRMSWLFNSENVTLPSVYLRSNFNARDKVGMIRGRINEALRVSRKRKPRSRVLAYYWYKYQNQKDVFLTREDTVNAIREIMERGADGFVIWGSSFDLNNRTKCQDFRDHLNEVLGPAVVEVKEMANQRVIVDLMMAENSTEVEDRNATSRENSLDVRALSRPSAMIVP